MDDNELLKALEICAKNANCTGCPFRDVNKRGGEDCISFGCKQAIDLINRQKAEIERLHNSPILTVLCPMWKAEAIRKCAEKTHMMITGIYNKHIFGNNDLNDEQKEAIMDFCNDVESGIDSIVEEMTEREHESD